MYIEFNEETVLPQADNPSIFLSDLCFSMEIIQKHLENVPRSNKPAADGIPPVPGISIPAKNGIGIETFGIGIEVLTNTWVRYWYWYWVNTRVLKLKLKLSNSNSNFQTFRFQTQYQTKLHYIVKLKPELKLTKKVLTV